MGCDTIELNLVNLFPTAQVIEEKFPIAISNCFNAIKVPFANEI